MTDRLVTFIEFPESRRQKREPKKVLIHTEHVSAVVPYRDYTSVRVDGYWFHLDHTLEEVLAKLEFEKEPT